MGLLTLAKFLIRTESAPATVYSTEGGFKAPIGLEFSMVGLGLI